MQILTPLPDQTVVSREYARPLSNQVLVAVAEVLDDAPYHTDRTVDYDDDEGLRAPRYRSVPISPGESQPRLEEGYYPTRCVQTPMVVGVVQREKALYVWVHLRREDSAMGSEFFKQVDARPPVYRGQVVGLSDEAYPFFLDVPQTSFEQDVTLEPGIQLQIERHVLHFAERARSLRPVLLLWEDLDLTVRNRDAGGGTRELGELLAQLDGPESADGIITCASTNDVGVLDRALSARPSRFDCVVHVAPPRFHARLRMLRRFASRVNSLEADLACVAARTDGLTGADLRELVVAAFTCALDAAEADTGPVRTEHFLQALQQLDRRRDGVDRWRNVWGLNH